MPTMGKLNTVALSSTAHGGSWKSFTAKNYKSQKSLSNEPKLFVCLRLFG